MAVEIVWSEDIDAELERVSLIGELGIKIEECQCRVDNSKHLDIAIRLFEPQHPSPYDGDLTCGTSPICEYTRSRIPEEWGYLQSI